VVSVGLAVVISKDLHVPPNVIPIVLLIASIYVPVTASSEQNLMIVPHAVSMPRTVSMEVWQIPPPVSANVLTVILALHVLMMWMNVLKCLPVKMAALALILMGVTPVIV
jgi:hypothetical protein